MFAGGMSDRISDLGVELKLFYLITLGEWMEELIGNVRYAIDSLGYILFGKTFFQESE